jgi:hypothetical protein
LAGASQRKSRAALTRDSGKGFMTMTNLLKSSPERNKLHVLPRPHIETARDCAGWYILNGSHGWICGDRRRALREFRTLVRIEREGRA